MSWAPTRAAAAFSSNVAFVGGTLARNVINAEEGRVNSYFVSGTVYQDFAGSRTAVFTPGAGAAETISIGKTGTIGEVSLGWSFLKSLGGTSTKPSQLTSTIRLDSRFGENISDSLGVTAQIRLTF